MLGLLCIFMITMILTELARRYAQNNLLDMPNSRSNHAIPTPRGGGIAFVLVSLCFLSYQFLIGALSAPLAGVLGLGGGIIAFIGYLDDHVSLSAKFRLGVQSAVVLAALFSLAPLSSLHLLGMELPSGLMFVLCAFGVVWTINLYNFMDGINGIAGLEGVFFFLTSAVLFYISPHQMPFSLYLSVLSLSIMGFLCFNFPRAQIFMGDVGSSFLGFVAGFVIIYGLLIDERLFYAELILLALFIADSSLTLILRYYRGERVTEAHKTHAYQRAYAQFGLYKVTLFCVFFNLFLLFPIAFFVAQGYISPFLGLICAYFPAILVIFFV